MIEDYKCAMNEFLNFPPKARSSNLIMFKYDNTEEVKKIYNRVINNNIKLFNDLKQTDYDNTEFAIVDCDENIIIISD